MASYILKRFGSMVIVLFCAITAVFFLFEGAQGDPFATEKGLSEKARMEKLRMFKLHESPWENYKSYLADLLRGDLRASIKAQNFQVTEIVAAALPVSFTLGGTAFVLAATVGILAGAFAAARKSQPADRLVQVVALTFISTPTFVTGPLLGLVFAIMLGWLPVGGWYRAENLILPAACLALYYGSAVARLMRNSMAEVLNKDFVRTARAKGLAESRVIYKHALKVAILPVVSYLGPMAAYLLTGSMVVETIFAIPGMGQHFVNAVLNQDRFLLIGAVIIYCVLIVLCNLAVDLIYCVLDRRVKLHG